MPVVSVVKCKTLVLEATVLILPGSTGFSVESPMGKTLQSPSLVLVIPRNA